HRVTEGFYAENRINQDNLFLESDHFDYGIEEQLEKETSSEQMAVDVEITKVNLPKAPMELNIYRSQNESEEEDYLPKRSKTTHLIVQELPKLPTPHRKRNDMVNLALMEIDPNKASGESNMEINPMQEEKIKRSLTLWNIPNKTPAHQIRKNLSFYGRLMVKSFKANGKSKAAFIEIEFKNEKQTLAERSRYKLIAKNIPKWAIESVLLRQCISLPIATGIKGEQLLFTLQTNKIILMLCKKQFTTFIPN
ncbi:19701_t:CDS:2, partial [Gigaspora margarita]